MVLARPLTDLSACLRSCTSSPQQCVKCQLRYWEGASINIPCKITKGKVFAHLEFNSKECPWILTDLSAWWDSAPHTHNRMSNSNFNIGEGTLKISRIKFPTEKLLCCFRLKLMTMSLTNLSVWVGFCISRPQ